MAAILSQPQCVNIFGLEQNDWQFEYIFKCICLNQNLICVLIPMLIPMEFVLKGQIDNKISLISGYGLAANRRQASTLTLYVLNFSEGTKTYKFTFYVIPPHWHDTGSWNPSSSKTRTYLFYIVNIMGAVVLATQGTRVSAIMILTMLNWVNSVPTH